MDKRQVAAALARMAKQSSERQAGKDIVGKPEPLTKRNMKPGIYLREKRHPQWGIWKVLKHYSGGTWEIRGDRGERVLEEGEFKFWEVVKPSWSKQSSERQAGKDIAVARELIGVARVLVAGGDYLEFGFAFSTGDQYLIERNYRDAFGGAPQDADWDEINEAISKMEKEAVKFLRRKLTGARDEGHNSDGDLIGSAWVKWSDKRVLAFVYQHADGGGDDFELDSDMERAVFKGIRRGDPATAVTCQLRFFGIDDDDMERLEDAL